MTTIYRVSGMSCEGCVRSLTNAIRERAPAAEVDVDLAAGTVSVGGGVGEAAVRAAVEAAGFEYEGLAGREP